VLNHNLWFWHTAFSFLGTLNDIKFWEGSLLLESIINGQHKLFDFDFAIDKHIFSKLFYLIDGSYHCIATCLPTGPDPTTKLDISYAVDQEGGRKDVARSYGVLNIKYILLTHLINLHHCDDIYYVILAFILMHNVIVDA
jgi:hypothetical protein